MGRRPRRWRHASAGAMWSSYCNARSTPCFLAKFDAGTASKTTPSWQQSSHQLESTSEERSSHFIISARSGDSLGNFSLLFYFRSCFRFCGIGIVDVLSGKGCCFRIDGMVWAAIDIDTRREVMWNLEGLLQDCGCDIILAVHRLLSGKVRGYISGKWTRTYRRA